MSDLSKTRLGNCTLNDKFQKQASDKKENMAFSYRLSKRLKRLNNKWRKLPDMSHQTMLWHSDFPKFWDKIEKWMAWNLGENTYMETMRYSRSLPIMYQFDGCLDREEHMSTEITAFILTILDSKCKKGKHPYETGKCELIRQ